MCPRIKAKIHFIRLAATKSARGEFQLLTHSRPCFRTRAFKLGNPDEEKNSKEFILFMDMSALDMFRKKVQ